MSFDFEIVTVNINNNDNNNSLKYKDNIYMMYSYNVYDKKKETISSSFLTEVVIYKHVK